MDVQKAKKCNHYECNKNLKLTDFECRCEYIYCIKHRLPESHNCNYNFKLTGKEKLRLDNPICIASKIIKL